ncbi:MAG TPA: TIGR02588 family protein [Chloroflexaceae bacterium]|nr:TIGR02588 family protein [Chloroflexaceae bacterium]
MSAEAQPAGEPRPEGERQGEGRRAGGRPLAEWVSFGVAAALLAVVVGLVGYLWWRVPPTPPVLTISQSGPIRREGAQHYVPFTVANGGGATADAVVVRAELRVGGEVVEEGEQEFSFLSGGEREEGAFVFTRDPGAGALELRVVGYRLP